MKRIDAITNNEIHTYLPLSNFSGFISLVESNPKKAIREDYSKKVKEDAKEEAKKEKRREKKCKNCNVNQTRRMGMICNKCYNLKMTR